MTYTGIFIFRKNKVSSKLLYKKFGENDSKDAFSEIDFLEMTNDFAEGQPWYFDNFENELLPVLKEESVFLEEATNGILQGIATGKDSVFIVDEETVKNYNLERSCLQKILKGKDISPWIINWKNNYLIYPYDKRGKVIEEMTLKTKFPNVYSYLISKRDELLGRAYFDRSTKKWYELWNQRNLERFQLEKLITLDNASKNSFAFDDSGYVGTTTVYSIIPKHDIDIKFLLSLLNSKALEYYHKKNTIPQAGGFYRYQALFIKGLPIKKPKKEVQLLFTQIVNYILYLKGENSAAIISHTDNNRLSNHFEDILNMMVYELYFKQHMKEAGIDVLQFIEEKLNEIRDKSIHEQIKEFYLWYQKPENPIRQRMQLIETRSPNIIALINKSLQQ
jgi:hypothetical protein